MSNIELPPKYYHDNFEYLLDFVKDKYKDIMLASEWQFLRKYYSLPEDAQCLFIRFTNRKGLFFKTDTLKYQEIESIAENLVLLKERNFLSQLGEIDSSLWIDELLSVLTKAELLACFPVKELKSAKRDEIINAVKNGFSASEIVSKIDESQNVVKANFENEVAFLKFLFFGNRSMDMTEFVLRDLGLVQYYKQHDDNLVARFTTRKEAEDKWLVSEQYLIFSEIKSVYSPFEIYDWYLNFRDMNSGLSPIAIPAFQKLQLNIGQHLERSKAFDLAVDVYSDAKIPPARERMARSLVKAKFFDEARAVCNEMLASPINVDEQYFAEYFLTTLSGKKNKKQTTETLKEADEIYISEAFRHQVELGSLEYFLERGYEGAFSENFSWRAMFGLFFWEIIFDPRLVSFHHPFQRRPSDLYLPDFYEKRENQILNKLQDFKTNDELVEMLWETYEQHYGTANPFVLWEPQIWGMVKILASRIEVDALKKILKTIAQNLVENSRGLPDLLIWNESEYELIEIKSPNDTLSNQQLFWLRFFKTHNVNARVLRVKFG